MCKKFTLFIAVCLFATATAFADVPINETNFPDPNFRAWLLARPWGSDGVITEEEIAEITSISILHSHISDLTGINFFTYLQSLWVSSNRLTTLDVSNLTNLIGLSVTWGQLTSLDVSNLMNLRNLDVGWNQLASIDLTGLNNLTFFGGSNQTPTLTLTGVDNNYSIEIELNNPTNLVSGLTYENGILTSTDNTITSSPFTVETGHIWNFRLSGTLTLKYTEGTNIPEINVNRTPVAFYTITGVRLGQKPQSGIFIILYDDGSAEKVMR